MSVAPECPVADRAGHDSQTCDSYVCRFGRSKLSECPPGPHNCKAFHPELDALSDAVRDMKVLREQPRTGDGESSRTLVITLPAQNPTTAKEYAEWAKFRVESLQRWLRMDIPDTDSLILETIARIEGDLMQVRNIVKGVSDNSVQTDRVLFFLTAESLPTLDEMMSPEW